MNVITLSGDSCKLHPQATRVTPPPRLRSRWTLRKPSPTSRPAYIGPSLRLTSPPASNSSSPLPCEQRASLFLTRRTFLGPSNGVRLSVSLQRLNLRKKNRIEALLGGNQGNSALLKPELGRSDPSIRSIFLRKLTPPIKPIEKTEREMDSTILIRTVRSELRPVAISRERSSYGPRRTCNGMNAMKETASTRLFI
jgi:hypothetical protein